MCVCVCMHVCVQSVWVYAHVCVECCLHNYTSPTLLTSSETKQLHNQVPARCMGECGDNFFYLKTKRCLREK